MLQCGYAESKRNVLRWILNVLTDGAVRQFSGREFQSLGAATETRRAAVNTLPVYIVLLLSVVFYTVLYELRLIICIQPFRNVSSFFVKYDTILSRICGTCNLQQMLTREFTSYAATRFDSLCTRTL